MKRRPAAEFSFVFAVLTSLSVAHAQAPPHQRPGLWLNDMSQAGRHFSMKACVDAASEARTSVFSASVRKGNKCRNSQLTHNLDGSWTSVSTCEFQPGVTRTSRADIRGDFNSKYTVTLRSPPTAPPEMTMTATYLGACGPGQKGGDIVMSDGRVINPMASMGR